MIVHMASTMICLLVPRKFNIKRMQPQEEEEEEDNKGRKDNGKPGGSEIYGITSRLLPVAHHGEGCLIIGHIKTAQLCTSMHYHLQRITII